MAEQGAGTPPVPGRNPVRVGMIGLGCAKNQVDAEVMLGHLTAAGAEVTADPSRADVVVVNTCGFIVDAKQESIEAILEVAEAKKSGSVRRLVVAGCMVQVYANELKAEIPEIDAFVGLDELEAVVAAVRGELADHVPDQRGALRLYSALQPRLVTSAGFAYLKVAEGCNNPCTFCHIPAMRGRFRSRPVADLVAEAQRLEAAGVHELVLIAQDTTRYGQDLGLKHGLAGLLSTLVAATGLPWIRFLYAYPTTLDRAVLEVMAREERVVSYLDMPLQHASRSVLQAMKRGGSARAHRQQIADIRRTVPGVTLRTTMIVGFPGEGEDEFAELLDFCAETRFDHLGAFAYSWQEENPGAALGDPVPTEVKAERRDRLLSLQHDIALAHNQALVGQRLSALVVGPLAEMELLTEARLQRQAPEVDGRLLINDGSAASGALVEVEVTEAHPFDLVATLVRELRPAPKRPTIGALLPVLAVGTGAR